MGDIKLILTVYQYDCVFCGHEHYTASEPTGQLKCVKCKKTFELDAYDIDELATLKTIIQAQGDGWTLSVEEL